MIQGLSLRGLGLRCSCALLRSVMPLLCKGPTAQLAESASSAIGLLTSCSLSQDPQVFCPEHSLYLSLTSTTSKMFSIKIQNSHLNFFFLLKNDDGVFEGFEVMNKASRGNRILVQLFQTLKDDAVKMLHSICQHIWKTQQRPQDWKRSIFFFLIYFEKVNFNSNP